MNILMISSTFPYPPSRGGTEIRTFNLLKYLHQRHHVTLLTQRHSIVTEADIAALRGWTSELIIFPLPPEPKPGLGGKLWRFLESTLKGTPPNVLYRYSPQLQAWIDAWVEAGEGDAITCEHSVNEIYLRPQWRSKIPAIANIHSSVYGWMQHQLAAGASSHPWRDRLYLPLLYYYLIVHL